MAQVQTATPELASMAERQPNAEGLFELGILCATGDGVDADLIAAHKWFNLAAMRGHVEAVYHRQQIAEDMSAPEIAAAQRDARKWLTEH